MHPSPASQRAGSFSWSAGALLLTVLVAVAVCVPFAHSRAGATGVQAVLVAAATCCSAATLALAAAALLRGPDKALHGLLLGTLFRMGVPLGVAAWLTRQGGSLAQAGVFGWIVVFFLITLVAETLLSLRFVRTNGSNSKVA